jgi:hypothetical protein
MASRSPPGYVSFAGTREEYRPDFLVIQEQTGGNR